MSGPLILALVAVTSGAVYLAGRRRGRTRAGLRRAGGRVLEALGLGAVFYVANLGLGAGLVLGLRASGTFVSLYDVADPTLIVLSLAQALVAERWFAED